MVSSAADRPPSFAQGRASSEPSRGGAEGTRRGRGLGARAGGSVSARRRQRRGRLQGGAEALPGRLRGGSERPAAESPVEEREATRPRPRMTLGAPAGAGRCGVEGRGGEGLRGGGGGMGGEVERGARAFAQQLRLPPVECGVHELCGRVVGKDAVHLGGERGEGERGEGEGRVERRRDCSLASCRARAASGREGGVGGGRGGRAPCPPPRALQRRTAGRRTRRGRRGGSRQPRAPAEEGKGRARGGLGGGDGRSRRAAARASSADAMNSMHVFWRSGLGGSRAVIHGRWGTTHAIRSRGTPGVGEGRGWGRGAGRAGGPEARGGGAEGREGRGRGREGRRREGREAPSVCRRKRTASWPVLPTGGSARGGDDRSGRGRACPPASPPPSTQ